MLSAPGSERHCTDGSAIGPVGEGSFHGRHIHTGTTLQPEPTRISVRLLAEKLGVAASTLNRVPNGASRVTPEIALRLSKVLGRSPESWLAMQDAHDPWVARQHVDLAGVSKLDLTEA